MKKRTRHKPDQIIGKLRDAEVLISQGKTVEEVCQALGVSEQTYLLRTELWSQLSPN